MEKLIKNPTIYVKYQDNTATLLFNEAPSQRRYAVIALLDGTKLEVKLSDLIICDIL